MCLSQSLTSYLEARPFAPGFLQFARLVSHGALWAPGLYFPSILCITVLGFWVVSRDPNLSFVGCTQQALNELITFPAVGSFVVV